MQGNVLQGNINMTKILIISEMWIALPCIVTL